MATRTTPGLLERDLELEALQSALGDAADGDGRLVVIEGEAGIGKSRLLDAAADAAERAGLKVLRARGTELERDFPFALVGQLFGPVVRALDQSERSDVLDEAVQPAGPIVGTEPTPSGTDVLGDASFQMLNALFWLTSNLAERTPVLLSVDDAHWSDQASLRFLAFLLPRLGDLPVLLAVSVRTGEPESDAELLKQLRSDPTAAVLRPSPLSQDSVADLVRRDLASEAADSFCAACGEASGGNPFMLNELVRELRADRWTGSDADAAEIRKLAPESIQRSVFARLARLSDEAQMLARAIAVLGDDAEVREAAALAGLDSRQAGETADALVSASILEAGQPLQFSHPLLRNAVYADLAAGKKADLHRRAAQQLSAAGAESTRIAVHLLATEPSGDPKVVETLTAAARDSLTRGAAETAHVYARRALDERPAPTARPELLLVLLAASYRSMDPTAVAELNTDLLEELTVDKQALYGIAAELGPILFASGRSDEAMQIFDRAKATALKERDYGRLIHFDAQIDWWADTSDKEHPDWDRYAQHLGEDSPGQRLRLAMKAYAGVRGSVPAARAADWASRAIRGGTYFGELGEDSLTALPVWALMRADALDEAAQGLDYYSRRAMHTGPATIIISIFLRGLLASVRGQVAGAEPDLRDAVERARATAFVSVTPDWTGELVEVLTERSELDDAERELEMSGMIGPLPDRIRFCRVLHARGCLRLAQGRTAEGLEDLKTLSERYERFDWSNPLYPTDAVRAIALTGAGEADAAQEAAEKYRLAAERWGAPRAKGVALHCLGIVEGGDSGRKLIEDAVATLRRSPAQLELARALTDLGASLRRDNQRAAAREPLREALDIARRNGALRSAQRAHDELEATGEKLRPLLADGVESLTPSERRVAGLAAAGKTNRAIAQELFLTVKTIEAHLSSAYRKLDIASRSELPDALDEAV